MRIDRRAGWFMGVLIALLIAAPASWGTAEGVQAGDSAVPDGEAKTDDTDQSKPKKKEPVRCVDNKPLSSFNTVEDIQAHDGSSESLVETPETSEDGAPGVIWRKVEPPKPETPDEPDSGEND